MDKPMKVYVGGHLPNHINSNHIREHFKAYETSITDVMVMRDRQTKQTLGFAVITFLSHAAAQDAIAEMNGTYLHGRFHLKVEEKHDRREHTSRHPSNMSHEHAMSYVAIRNINSALSENDLKMVLNDMGIHFDGCYLEADDSKETKSAMLMFSAQSNAEVALSSLDGMNLLGQQVTASIIRPGNSSHSPDTRQSSVVKVSHIPPTVTKEKLEAYFQQVGHVVSSKIHWTNNPYAHVHFSDPEGARLAVERLNKSTVDGQQIGVRLYEQEKPPQEKALEQRLPSNDHRPPRDDRGPHGGQRQPFRNPRPHKQYNLEQHASEQAVDKISDQFHGVCLSNPPQRALSTTEQFFTRPSLLTQVSSPIVSSELSFQKSITCTPEQWNRLLTIDASGNNLFQDITYPFKSNPNVQIQPQYETHVILITGTSEAVTNAKECIEKCLAREVSIDKAKMTALLHFFPTLNNEIQRQCNIKVSGYVEGSTVVQLDGAPSTIKEARVMLEKRLQSIIVDSIQLPCIQLIASANKRLEREGLRAFVFPSLSVPTCHLCAYESFQMESAMKVLWSKPYENHVNLPTDNLGSVLDSKILDLQAMHSVAIVMQPKKVIITSYVMDDVHTARQEVEQLVNIVGKLSVPLKCSQQLHLYLNMVFLRVPTDEDKAIASSLPVEISFKRGEIILTGLQHSIVQAQEKIQRDILSLVQYKEFNFRCNTRFLSQIKQYIFTPLKDKEKLDFVYIDDMPKKPSNIQAKEFSIVVYSRVHNHFTRICNELEHLKPSSKRCNLKPGSVQIVSDLVELVEPKYRARVVIANGKEHGDAVLIHALTEKDVNGCWAEIEETINSKLVIEKIVPLSCMQLKYLEVKCKDEMRKMKTNGLEIFISHNDKDRGDSFLKAKGTMNQVSVLEETLKELFDDEYCEIEFDVESDIHLLELWKKRWEQIKDKQERLLDILIDFTPKPSALGQPPVSLTSFRICGHDERGIQEIKNTICTKECKKCVKKKTIQIPSNSAVTPSELNNLEINQLNVKVMVDKANVIIIAPEQTSDDLNAAEEIIQKYLGNVTLKNESIMFSDPVLELIFASKLGKQTLEKINIAGISVRFLKPPQIGVSISGIQSAIDAAKPKVRQILQELLDNIDEISFPIHSQYSSLLGSVELSHFLTKLQTDFAVLCTVPKSQPYMNKIIHSIPIKPTLSAHCMKVEIVEGNIVNESVSAVVNAANESLEHIGGVAKVIADAGGPSIQEESKEYITTKGNLKLGDALCLGSGELPCKKLIHAVGPRWSGGIKNEETILYFTVQNILKVADKESLESIALPAVSCGIFGFPENICARAILKSIRDFCQANPNSKIHTIRCVLTEKVTLHAFCEALKLYFPESSNVESQDVLTDGSKQWQWEDDTGSFTTYSSDICDTLSDQYAKNPNAKFPLQIGKHNYMIDFSLMVQINRATKKERKIQCISSLPTSQSMLSGGQWCYLNDAGQFVPYTIHDSSAIQTMYLNKTPGVLIINKNSYTFDFNTMLQINTVTRHPRRIEFRIIPSKPVIKKDPFQSTFTCKDICVTLRGPKFYLEKAKNNLLSKLKSSFSCKTVSLPAVDCKGLQEKLVEIAQRHQVTYSFEESQSQVEGKCTRQLKVEGLTSTVLKTVNALQEEIIRFQSSTAGGEERPPEWQPQSKTTELFKLIPGTSEWSHVAQKFQATMSQARIISIQRIQNTWLWDRYVKHRKRLELKNSGVVNEMELFHGTRNNDPKLIYEGEDGFDMRYSAEGMWGMANYFAVNASYSDTYAHQISGQKEMFFVKLLTGESYDCPPNRTLRMPPAKPHSRGPNSQVQLAQMKYDTVTGTTNGSRVYMAYDNEKAYPAYLITYTQVFVAAFY